MPSPFLTPGSERTPGLTPGLLLQFMEDEEFVDTVKGFSTVRKEHTMFTDTNLWSPPWPLNLAHATRDQISAASEAAASEGWGGVTWMQLSSAIESVGNWDFPLILTKWVDVNFFVYLCPPGRRLLALPGRPDTTRPQEKLHVENKKGFGSGFCYWFKHPCSTWWNVLIDSDTPWTHSSSA